MTTKFLWTPKRSVDQFRFGDPISKFLTAGEIVKSEFFDEDSKNPDYIDPTENISFVLDDALLRIESMLLDRTLTYYDQNLIGLNVDELIKLLGQTPDEIEEEYNVVDEVLEEILYFDELDLMVWTRDKKVRVVAVGDGDYEDD